MLHVFDIDGTLGKGLKGYMYYLNEHLQLGLTQQTLQDLRSYRAFTQLPEVQTFVQDNPVNQERYTRAYQEAQHDPRVQESLVPARDAVEAVNQLAKMGKVIYATCRKQESKGLTQEWLARHGFPSPDKVYICDHYHFKYVAAYQVADPKEYINLFDDHAEEVIFFFRKLARDHTHIAMSLHGRMTIFAYGAEQAPANPFKNRLFDIQALPAWENVLKRTGETVI